MDELDGRGANRSPVEPGAIAFSNGIRLTGREWVGLGLFAVVIVVFAPWFWLDGKVRTRARLPNSARPEQRLLALRALRRAGCRPW